MLRGLGNLANLMKEAQQLGGKLQSMREELKSRRATGAAGGGMVEVEVNGLQEIVRCRIDEKLYERDDRELLEDLLVAAVNDATAKARTLQADAMKSVTGGIELPGLNEALSGLTGAVPTRRPTANFDSNCQGTFELRVGRERPRGGSIRNPGVMRRASAEPIR